MKNTISTSPLQAETRGVAWDRRLASACHLVGLEVGYQGVGLDGRWRAWRPRVDQRRDSTLAPLHRQTERFDSERGYHNTMAKLGAEKRREVFHCSEAPRLFR